MVVDDGGMVDGGGWLNGDGPANWLVYKWCVDSSVLKCMDDGFEL